VDHSQLEDIYSIAIIGETQYLNMQLWFFVLDWRLYSSAGNYEHSLGKVIVTKDSEYTWVWIISHPQHILTQQLINQLYVIDAYMHHTTFSLWFNFWQCLRDLGYAPAEMMGYGEVGEFPHQER